MKINLLLFINLLLIITLASCNDNSKNQISEMSYPKDYHSYAEPNKAVTTHLHLILESDFEEKTLHGVAKWEIRNNNSEEIIFDTRDLNIQKIVLDDNEDATYSLSPKDKLLGRALHVKIHSKTKTVDIYYSTRPTSAAVQWLSAEQTADKKHPFLFTQGQAILTRTWIPCQDSPGIRVTYDATIKTPDGLLAVMSASNPQVKNELNIYNFSMPQAIPPYLIALAIGDLGFKEIGPRTAVYAEHCVLDKAAYEFEDMEKMLIAAEDLYGEYPWERYDVIVLPPSFPFGGMENPRLTFATPTILAGDKSLTSLIAHELAHSWSGNLVTNATWDDFWLNEGFTVYFERRIMEALYGKDYANMLGLLGQQDMKNTIESMGKGNPDSHLYLQLKDRDPDDGMTDIAYEKGAAFLQMLEQKVGRERFDLFLNEYFAKFKFQTITTTVFIDYLNNNLLNDLDEKVNIEEWIYQSGLPNNSPIIISDKFKNIDNTIDQYIKDGNLERIEVNNWTTHEWLHFIRHLPGDLTMTQMTNLDNKYGFSKSGNSEIAAAWYELSIDNGYYKNNIGDIEEFLVRVGRRKFLTPLYQGLLEANDAPTANMIYAKARQNYHAVSVQTLDELLEWEVK